MKAPNIEFGAECSENILHSTEVFLEYDDRYSKIQVANPLKCLENSAPGLNLQVSCSYDKVGIHIEC